MILFAAPPKSWSSTNHQKAMGEKEAQGQRPKLRSHFVSGVFVESRHHVLSRTLKLRSGEEETSLEVGLKSWSLHV